MNETPTAVKTLLKSLDGWSHCVSHAVGPCVFGGLSEDEDGNGKRRRVEVIETVESVLVRACHLDGRAFVALWLRRPGTTSAGKRKGWSLDLAWRGCGPDEHAPQQITATQLKAYVAAPDLRSALAALASDTERNAA